MTKAEAITILKRMQDPEAWEPQINQAAFEALDMAISALEAADMERMGDGMKTYHVAGYFEGEIEANSEKEAEMNFHESDIASMDITAVWE